MAKTNDELGLLAGGELESIDSVDGVDEQTRADLTKELTLALLYLTSTRVAGGASRRAKKGMGTDVLRSLDREQLIEMPRQGPVAITQEGCERAAKTITELKSALDGRKKATKVTKKGASGGKRAFRFRVELELWPEHPCWREIVVSARDTFENLHGAIQSAFLWWDEHCYDFELTSKGEKLRVESSRGGIDMMFAGLHGGRSKSVRADELLLSDVFPRTRTARYTYDYGDDWVHDIRLVETIDDCKDKLPFCASGEGDAPPEDVGSVPGYYDFLRIIADPRDPEHDEMVEWGQELGYTPFNLKAVNDRMRKWRSGSLRGFGW